MNKLRAAVIGCGGRGHAHALGYHHCEDVELVSCADIHLAAAQRMAEQYGFTRVYTDYREMLVKEKPDVVSMALWPGLHAEAVLACVNAPVPPRLINAEKPMAPTFGEAVQMHDACQRAGILLTFSHQRRFGRTFRRAKELIDEGIIGQLIRLEMNCSNLLDWGTHWFDMMLFYNNDLDPDWVLGQIGCAASEMVFGAQIETAGISYVKWPNNVTGVLTTGKGTGADCEIRVIGSAGMLIVDHGKVRVLREGRNWENAELLLPRISGDDTTRYIIDAVACLREGRESTLCSENALRATQLIFATYESSRKRQRVVLPLKTEGSPLLDMLKSEELVIPDWPAFLTEEEKAQGFQLIFDGHSLDGWVCSPPDAWTVSGGMLRGGLSSPGLVCTSRNYKDLHIAFEFRLTTSRARAGIQVRGTDVCEIAFNDDRNDCPGIESSGAVRGVLAPKENPNVGNTAWRWGEISIENGRLQVMVAGVETVNCTLSDIPELTSLPGEGPIAFCVHEGGMDLRNVMLRNPGEASSRNSAEL